MKPRDLLLALAVVFVWGVNFVVIEVGLENFPPLLFSALRFLLALEGVLPRCRRSSCWVGRRWPGGT